MPIMNIGATDIKNVKAQVKAELIRRGKANGVAMNQSNGSLAAYTGTNYDYSVVPAAGKPILVEHYNKMMTPLNALHNTSFAPASKSAGAAITSFVDAVRPKIATLIAQGVNSGAHGCAGSCSGLCYTGCYGNCTNQCTGCTGCTSCTSCTSCSGCSGCSGSCDDPCWSVCCSACSGCYWFGK